MLSRDARPIARPVMHFLFLVSIVCSGCYTFKGISIPEGAKTYYVNNIEDHSDFQLPNYNIQLTEVLKDKIRNESRLKWSENNPDIEFSAKIIGFTISSVSPEAGSVTAFNRLEVTLEVTYINHLDVNNTWTKRISQFDNFPADQDFLTAANQIIPGINNLIVEYIFNAAFTDW